MSNPDPWLALARAPLVAWHDADDLIGSISG